MKTNVIAILLTASFTLGGCASPEYAHTTYSQRAQATQTCKIIMNWEYPTSFREKLKLRQQCFRHELGVEGGRSLQALRKENLDTWYTTSDGQVIAPRTVQQADPAATALTLLAIGATAGAIRHAGRPRTVHVRTVHPPRPPRR